MRPKPPGCPAGSSRSAGRRSRGNSRWPGPALDGVGELGEVARRLLDVDRRRSGAAQQLEAALAVVAWGEQLALVADQQHAGLADRLAVEQLVRGRFAAVVPGHRHAGAVGVGGEIEVDDRPLRIAVAVVARRGRPARRSGRADRGP